MSFLDIYVKKYKLDAPSESVYANLQKIEQHLSTVPNNGSTFEDVISDYSDELMDLIRRFTDRAKFLDLSSWSSAVQSFRFIISAGIEVYQIIEAISDKIISSNPGADHLEQKLNFGQDVIYFVWKIVDPIKNIFKWLPFKSYIEKKVVMWVSRMSLSAAFDFLKINKSQSDLKEDMSVKSMSNITKLIIIKAIP